jgi:hypothetical protein
MTQLAVTVPLTAENLKAFSQPTYRKHHAAPSSSASEDDAASLFSVAESVMSSTSSAPEDEGAPFTVQTADGESITVYESLEQAVRYSLVRVEQERRREEEGRRFAHAPRNASGSSAASMEMAPVAGSWPAASQPSYGWASGGAEVQNGDEDEDVDEDAYFSMG